VGVVTADGFFAPVTATGFIVVDDVVASCYAHVANAGRISGHRLAHSALAPLRACQRLGIPIFGEKSQKESTYIKGLQKVFRRWVFK
jgi:hypothetical protein